MALGHAPSYIKGGNNYLDPLKGVLVFPYNLPVSLPMGRRSSDSVASHSSIALLQERFRRLQRAKEMREERELLRQFSQSPSSPRINPTEFCEPSRSFFHSELILAHGRPLPGSLSSQHNKHSDHLQTTETPILVNLWPPEKAYQASKSFDDSDVDTSLHL